MVVNVPWTAANDAALTVVADDATASPTVTGGNFTANKSTATTITFPTQIITLTATDATTATVKYYGVVSA
jgi:hypothetical protein